ncbi:hypothetical protein Tco_0715044 [Tanacetum coccineum]
MTKAMSLIMSRRMVVSVRKSSTAKLRGSSQALLMFVEQSHDEVRILIKKDKIKAKRIKPGTGMKKARETEAEGKEVNVVNDVLASGVDQVLVKDFASFALQQAANLAVQKEQEEQEAQSFTPYWKFPIIDDDEEYNIQYREYLERSSKAITPNLSTEEPDNSLSIGDEHLNTILETESDEVIKFSVEDLVPIPSESKGIFEDIYDVPFCDNDHFDAEFGLMDSLLSRDISITSPKIDFLPEEFAGELDLIDPILPGINEDDFDEEEGAIDIDILQIKDEILREKLLNVNLLIDKIEALNLTPSIPFVLEYPSSSSIPVVDSDFLIEEVDTFLVSEDSIPPGIESDFDSEGDIIFLDDLLTMDPILPDYSDCLDFEDSRARGFVHRPLDLQSFACLY